MVSVIDEIKTNVTNAYTALNAKKAAIPEHKNIENLASTIDSIVLGEKSDDPNAVLNNNIRRYKSQDLQRVLQNDTEELSTDEEYADAEIQCQKIYNKVIGGSI